MHRRVKEYKRVPYNELPAWKRTRRVKTRNVLAGLLSLSLVVIALPAFAFGDKEKVLAAEAAEEIIEEVEVEELENPGESEEQEGLEEPGELEELGTEISEALETLGVAINENIPDEFTAKVPKERKDILIVLDPGHGGADEGCSREQVYEKDINLAIARATETKLIELGYQVMLTRTNDEELTLEERTDKANQARAHLYVSIHQNACEEKSSNISGIEVWYNEDKGDDGSKRLAELVHNYSLLYTEANDREVIADKELYVIRETNMPACLIETGFLSNRAERDQLASEEYQAKLAEGIATGIDYYFFPKTMYLTFDDGPTADNTMAVLDILKEHNIKATFFLIGKNVEQHPEVAKRIVDEGHTIGIHCYDHNYNKIYKDVDSYVEDFEKAQQVIYEATGVEATIFRFPGGSINSHNKKVYKDIIQEMTNRGYVYFDWNASLEDATKHNEPERLLKNAKESTLGRKKVVMLAHDVITNTTLCLEDLLEMFPEYEMLPITEGVEPVQF